MRTTGYEKPASFRSNTEPESVREVGTGGNEMEAMRAQQEKFEPSPPPPMINLSPAVSSSPKSKSWSELSQSEHHSKSATLSLDASEPVQGRVLEGSGGKSWGEVRSDVEGGVMLRSQQAKGDGSTLEKVKGDIGEENEYRSGKDTATITKEAKEKAAEEVKEKDNTEKKSETDEEKLEPERTMEGLAESSEETNSLQAFRAVEKR